MDTSDSMKVSTCRVDALPRQTVAVLSRHPGLSQLSALIRMPLESTLRVKNGLRTARLDCGSIFSKELRATPSFIGRAWYDAVVIDPEETSSTSQSRRSAPDCVQVGDFRLLFRHGEQDMAVVCFWEPAPAAPGCSIAARACKRLRWAFPPSGGGDWLVRSIPGSRSRRVVHVVLDLEELAKTRVWMLYRRPPTLQ